MNKNKKFITDLVVAGCFIALGVLAPSSTLMSANSFYANMTGIATGAGLGWLVKTLIDSQKSASTDTQRDN